MSSCVAELEGILQSMLELKAPGVSGPKIKSITSLCDTNIQSESVLIQKVYTHFKKAPSNKKLGVLYVVDSVARSWLDQARKSGQQLGSAASDGTFAAGVNHVSELLPSFMNDIIAAAPDDQKAKIKKLIDIWERGNTFPTQMLSGFKDKLNAPAASDARSTTPTGTPPTLAAAMNPQMTQKAAAATQDTSSILANLQALASLSNNSAAAPAAPQGSSNNVSFPPAFQQNAPSVNAAFPQIPAQAVNPPAPTPVNGGVFSYGGVGGAGGNGLPPNLFPGGQANVPVPTAMPQSMPQFGAGGNDLNQQLAILGALKAQGIPEAQWPALLSVLMAAQNGGAQVPQLPQQQQQQNTGFGGNDSSRDRNGYDQYGTRSPPDRYGGRNRSRSPDYDRRRDGSPGHRRDSPVYGDYGGGGGRGGDQGGRRRGGRNNYRQRSPDRFRKRSQSPDRSLPPPGEKLVEYDPNLGEGKIRVLSRTLFVGGVTCSENDLRAIFSEFGRVQTCIVNIDKRHAFVKMVSRTDAIRAKEGMEQYKSDSMQLRTRWGVGFGPRDCSDYQTGVSIIPIDRLTDADRKWMTTAEYGGSGNKGINSQMVVEEPDIEIGAGVSSKAISRRMQTDKSGPGGPRSSRDGLPVQNGQNGHNGGNDGNGGGGRRFHNRRDDRDQSNPNNIGVAPQVPSFGFPFQFGSNGMPILPPGFMLNGQNQSQPPPPGA